MNGGPLPAASAAARGLAAAILLGCLAATASVATAAPASAPPLMYFSTFRPAALNVTTVAVSSNHLRLGTPRVVKSLPGADGLEVATDGDVLVGGETSGNIFKIHPADGSLQTEPSGLPGAYSLAQSPDHTRVYTAGLPGDLAVLTLHPFGPGQAIHLHGDDTQITAVGFTPGNVFYTTGNRRGTGNFGTIDLATGMTTRTITGLRGAHGLIYDAFSGDIVVIGSYAIEQIDPADPHDVVSERLVTGMNFDQGVADGNGHLLLASNTGAIVYVDYSATKLVGAAHTIVSSASIQPYVDDVAITAPIGPTATAGSRHSRKGTIAVIILGAVVVVLLFLVASRRRRA